MPQSNSTSKTIQLDADVVQALKSGGVVWHNEGRLAALASGMHWDLARRVSAALVAMGGRPERSSGGIVFLSDPRQAISTLVARPETPPAARKPKPRKAT